MTVEGGSDPADGSFGPGLTPTERYLGQLCQRNFLSLWSHPRPFRNQGGGKEICDLLVVMGNDVIIFSDKHCVLDQEASLEIGWRRWFKAAVAAAAKQAWGAERWLRRYPDRVFADEACSSSLPVRIPDPADARYHLVVTVHGIAEVSRLLLGGSGSLLLNTTVQGLENHAEPFVIGDLDPERTFVHVLDGATLDMIMKTLDTTPDFLSYLREKERLCRSHTVFVAGEENLLAYYLTHLDTSGEHAVVVEPDVDVVGIDDTWWTHFEQSDERRAQLSHDRVSYLWDALIERFAEHALTGRHYEATEPAVESSETVLRFLASEPRLRRRSLAEALATAVRDTPESGRRLRVIPSQQPGEPMYVFVAYPWNDALSDDENRSQRRSFLVDAMYVARMKYRNADDVVGLATESGAHRRQLHSEDAVYFDARHWGSDDDEKARTVQQLRKILVEEQAYAVRVDEYPSAGREQPPPQQRAKTPRNSPCPCGSGRKYKRCHGG